MCFTLYGMVVCFRGDQIFMDFIDFLSMIIYEVLYAWCLRYNICSAWFLDIEISTRLLTCISDEAGDVMVATPEGMGHHILLSVKMTLNVRINMF